MVRRRVVLVASFMLVLATGRTSADELDSAVQAAIERSVPLLERSQAGYIENRSCFSCHHQSLPAMALAVVRERGFVQDRRNALIQSAHTKRHFAEKAKSVRNGAGVPGGPYTAGYALVGMHASGWPADQTTADLVQYLLKTQRLDGHWPIGTNRPPLEYSDFTSTALAVRALGLYGDSESRQRVIRARQWLEGAKVKTHEDKVFHLLGLKWTDADSILIKRAADLLREEQRDDGGWGQLAGMSSDAYATGQALVALCEAGELDADSSIHRRGVQFLLRTQLQDGSWLVKSRSKPFQTYFESGFPHKEHQWISICATSWAVMALAGGN
jgi:N-acyl-D-amino-acid deacylase